MVKISVVIGTYNQKGRLKQVLESFCHQTFSHHFYEVIVVDSSSTDGTDQMIKFLSLPYSINYIHQENRGKSSARNKGIFEAKGEIILLTDADMVADPHILLEHFIAHERKHGCAYEGLTYNLKHQTSDFKINPNDQSTKDQIEPYIKKKVQSGQKLKWAYFLSGNLSISKKIICDAGMFDYRFSQYGWEDIELGYRLSKRGIPLYYLPSAINYHIHPISQEDIFRRKYNMGKSAATFYKKHPNSTIKYFLGMNPIAQGIYKLIKSFPKLQNSIKSNAKTSNFCRYLWGEFLYRKGFEKNK